MKNSNKIVCIIIALLFLYMGCKKSDDIVIAPPMVQNLITNSSFETESGPSIDGWTFLDSSIWKIVEDAPSIGGRYSIVLELGGYHPPPLPFSSNAITTKVALAAGCHRYRLSCWAKKRKEGEGALCLFVGSGDIDTMTDLVRIPIVDTIWTFYSSDISLSNQASDSVIVALDGGFAPVVIYNALTFFDLIKFEILN